MKYKPTTTTNQITWRKEIMQIERNKLLKDKTQAAINNNKSITDHAPINQKQFS